MVMTFSMQCCGHMTGACSEAPTVLFEVWAFKPISSLPAFLVWSTVSKTKILIHRVSHCPETCTYNVDNSSCLASPKDLPIFNLALSAGITKITFNKGTLYWGICL